MTKIAVIIGSNRQGRGTPKVANWVMKTARETQSETEFELVDIADYDLPFMTEPESPQEIRIGTPKATSNVGWILWAQRTGSWLLRPNIIIPCLECLKTLSIRSTSN